MGEAQGAARQSEPQFAILLPFLPVLFAMNTSAADPNASEARATNVSADRAAAEPAQRDNDNDNAADRNVVEKKKSDSKTLWVTIFRCFHCGKHGHDLRRCSQCAQAYYCNADCQRRHWRKHKPVCRATVAALARRATRVRLARAVREKGADNVEGAEEDTLCVICQAKPVDPVEVSPGSLSKWSRFDP